MAQSPYFYGGGTASARVRKQPVKQPAISAIKAAVKKQPVAKKPAAPKPPAAKAPAGTSAAQQIVNAALAPLLASIKSQETDLGTTQANQQAALRGFTNEILSYLSGAPTAIQNDYQGAVDTTRSLAQASADELLKANPNSLNQADLQAINAPQAQMDALAAQNQNVYGGGAATLFHTAGAIPATQFANDKATAAAFADSLPSIQGLQAQQLFAQLLANQNKDTQALAAQRAGVMAKAPQLLLDAQKSLAASAPSAKAPTTRKIGNGYYEWNPSRGWVLLAKASSSDRTSTVTLANGQKQTTVNGQPIGKPWGPARTKASGGSKSSKLYGNSTAGYFTYEGGKLTPVPGFAPAGKNGKKAPSASQVSTTVQRASKAGNAALDKLTDRVWKSAVAGASSEEEAQRIYSQRLPKSFGSAMYRVISAIGPHLKSIGYSQAQVKSAAYQIVSSSIQPPKGYKPPANPKNASYSPGRGGNPQQIAYQSPTVTFDSLSNRTVGRVGTDLGGPAAHYGKHDSGENWQSNNAWDIGVPIGTPIYAASDGVIGSQIGVQSSRPKDGQRLTLDGSDNSYWYGHLSRIAVRPGQRVKAGQLLGYSGASQNGAAHLHIGVKNLPGTHYA